MATALQATACWADTSERDAERATAIETRIANDAKFLSSDELLGRGNGSKGLDVAADHIGEQFAQAGLKTDVCDGTPWQRFSIPLGPKMGDGNKLALVGPPDEEGQPPKTIELDLKDDFAPLALSGTGEFDLPLVFVGYGITGEAEKYDDYADMDVNGRIVVVLRNEPQQDDAESPFRGRRTSPHGTFAAKVANAQKHGAAGVIFCNDRFSTDRTVRQRQRQWQQALDRVLAEHEKSKAVENPSFEEIESHRKRIEGLLERVEVLSESLAQQYDRVLSFGFGGRGNIAQRIPAIHCRRSVINDMVKATLDTTLDELEEQIDGDLKPRSAELTGWRAVGETSVSSEEAKLRNVVGVLEGEGPLADETIVIGAHYDHVGFRDKGDDPPKSEDIYNGADDNASGTAVLMEIARSLAAREEKLPRRIVFIAFSGEERGLLGSAHYVREPLFPIDKTVAMLNLDMVGRVKNDALTVTGTGTAAVFDEILDRLGEKHDLKLNKKSGGVGPSDHASFYRGKVPALHFFTGLHTDVHRTTDVFEKLNVPGMRRVGAMIEDMTIELAGIEDGLAHVETGRSSLTPARPRVALGCMPGPSGDGPGVPLASVTKNGSADKAGIKAGDRILKIGDTKIERVSQIQALLRRRAPGDKVNVVIQRGKEEKTIEVTLAPPG